MEVMAFHTDSVEYKLYDIMSALLITNLAVAGLAERKLINNDQLRGFEYIILDACRKADDLINGLKPVLVGEDKRIVMIFGEQATGEDTIEIS
jgi:hypothetical protein